MWIDWNWNVLAEGGRTWTCPAAAAWPALCPAETWTAARPSWPQRLCRRCRQSSWVEAAGAADRCLRGQEEESLWIVCYWLKAWEKTAAALVRRWQRGRTCLLLHLLLSLHRVLQVCDQAHVGVVISLHQLRQPREEPDGNALRGLESTQHQKHQLCFSLLACCWKATTQFDCVV